MYIILLIFAILCILYLCLIIYANKFYNPFDISMYFAPPGVGKTTFLNKLSAKYASDGWVVYSTSEDVLGQFIDVDDIYITDFKSNQKSLLIIDEASIIYNNRDFKTNFNRDSRGWWKLHRHHKVKVIMASQDYEDVDKLLRKLTTNYYLLSRFLGLWIIARKVEKGIVLTTPVGEQSGTFADGYKFKPLISRGAFQVCYLPYWIKKFDSYRT